MLFRKSLLGLPSSHCWVQEDWLEFEKLDKNELAEELQVPLEQVEILFPEDEEDRDVQEAMPMRIWLLSAFVEAESDRPQIRHPQLYASMFNKLFGIPFSKMNAASSLAAGEGDYDLSA